MKRSWFFNEEEQNCEKKFEESIQRLPSGRFEVSLPFKSDTNQLGSSFEIATRRFLALERKYTNDETMRNMYHDFMREYADLGHISIANNIFLISLYHISVF